MSKKAAEHHGKASEHLKHAAHHHEEAAKHHDAGHHEKAAHHAHTARGHVIHGDVAGQSHGIVDVFDLDGTFRQRFAQHDQLNSPWGVALAPTGFGELGGALWIGNFGNGHINAFDPDSGKFLSKVRDPKGKAILIDGLWTIRFGSGTGNGGSANTLYFTAGLNGETDGLFGSLNPN